MRSYLIVFVVILSAVLVFSQHPNSLDFGEYLILVTYAEEFYGLDWKLGT